MSIGALPTPDDQELETSRDVAVRVLRQESDALLKLAETLDGTFERVVDALVDLPGRVVTTGMGKSGHVARKLAATLASTGTPAFFVHPGEASHGDLGMITRNDAVVAFSYSGETPELADIVAFTRRATIPLVALTRRPGSALAQAADHLLLLPDLPEACPLGLAPTTSTVMMMALGDALAVALLERRGFTATDFRGFHPGGQLGRRLLKVSDLMHAGDEVPLVAPDIPLADAILVMTNKRFGCVGVTDAEGSLVGIITDGDLRRHMSPDLLERRAGDVMSSSPRTIRPGALAGEALAVMNGQLGGTPITSLFVVDGARPVGIIHVHDCLRAGVT